MHNVDITRIHKEQCGEGNAFFLEVEAGYQGDSSIQHRGQKKYTVGLSTSVDHKLAGKVYTKTNTVVTLMIFSCTYSSPIKGPK